jgi:hypothetical protein
MGSKGGRCAGLTPYILHMMIVLKSGSLNFLAPMGPVQVYTGIALPFYVVTSKDSEWKFGREIKK